MKAIVQDVYGSADVLKLRDIGRPSPKVRAPFLSMFTGQRLRTFLAKENAADYRALAEMAESGALTPVIDRTYPLADAAEAIRRIATGHATGKGVVTI